MNTQPSIASNMPPTRISPPIPETMVHNPLSSHHQNPLPQNRPSNIYQEGHYTRHKQTTMSPSPDHPESSKRGSPENEYTSPRDDVNSASTISQPSVKQPTSLDANRMLHVYIYDFLKKRQYNQTASQFLSETCLPLDNTRVPIDIQEGFLSEWWTVFWEIFSNRTSHTGSDAPQVSYTDMVSVKNEFEKKHKLLHNQVQQQQQYIQNISQNGKSLYPSETHLHPNINLSPEESRVLLDDKHEPGPERFSPRNLQSDQSTPSSCSSEPSISSNYNASISTTSISSSATKELDSLNLEEKRIWLSQLQQRSAAMLSPAIVPHGNVRHTTYQQQPNVVPSPMMMASSSQGQPPISHPSPTKRFRPDAEHQTSSNMALGSFQQTSQQPMYSTTPVQMVVQHRPQTHMAQHRPVQNAQTQGQVVYQRSNTSTNAPQSNAPVSQMVYHPQMQTRPQTIQVQVPPGTSSNQNVQVMMMQQQQRIPRHKQTSQPQQMMMVTTAMQPGGQQQFVVVPQPQQQIPSQQTYSGSGSPSQSTAGRPQGPVMLLNNLQGSTSGNIQVPGTYAQNQQVVMHPQQVQVQHPIVMHPQQMQMQSSNIGFNKAQVVHNPHSSANMMYHQQQVQQNMGGMMGQYVVQGGTSSNVRQQTQSNVAMDKTALEISYFAGLTNAAPSGVHQSGNMMVSGTMLEEQSQAQIDDDTIDRIEETLLGDLDDLFSQDTMTDTHLRKHDNIDNHPEGSYS